MSSHLPERHGQVRIGDAERDQAVAMLSDHFVAGRLTQDEFEERSEQATRAVQGPWSPAAKPARQRQRPVAPPPFVMLAPILMIGLVITAVTLTAPWLLWGLFWIALFSGAHRHRWHQNHYRR
jgi:hypothetical protein